MKVRDKKLVGWLALGMFSWGLLKATTIGRQLHHADCPLCTQRKLSSPGHLVTSLVVAPAVEEFQFREVLPKVLGDKGSAAAFGVAHMGTKLGLGGNVARAVEAGLAGGLVYAKAYKGGGLAGATVVHGAHNLGAALGTFFAMQDRVDREGWRCSSNAIGCTRRTLKTPHSE